MSPAVVRYYDRDRPSLAPRVVGSRDDWSVNSQLGKYRGGDTRSMKILPEQVGSRTPGGRCAPRFRDS